MPKSKTNLKTDSADINAVRLDKWLWAARFYKTRSLATDAIKGGKVHVNGQRVKPSKTAEIGQRVLINKSALRCEVEIVALSEQRQSFTIAQTLYEETAESIAKREAEAVLRKLANESTPKTNRRPTKRDRRKIIQFTDQPTD